MLSQDLSLVHHHAPLGTLHHRPTPSPSMLMVTKPKPEPLLINSHEGTESIPGEGEQKMDVPTKGPGMIIRKMYTQAFRGDEL